MAGWAPIAHIRPARAASLRARGVQCESGAGPPAAGV